MSVQKTPVALIQVMDSTGKVTNLEIEFSCAYVGSDPDIARNFNPGRVREEVDAETFAKYADSVLAEAAAELSRNALQIAEMQDKIAEQLKARVEETAAHESAIRERDHTIEKLTSTVESLAQRLLEIKKLTT